MCWYRRWAVLQQENCKQRQNRERRHKAASHPGFARRCGLNPRTNVRGLPGPVGAGFIRRGTSALGEVRDLPLQAVALLAARRTREHVIFGWNAAAGERTQDFLVMRGVVV